MIVVFIGIKYYYIKQIKDHLSFSHGQSNSCIIILRSIQKPQTPLLGTNNMNTSSISSYYNYIIKLHNITGNQVLTHHHCFQKSSSYDTFLLESLIHLDYTWLNPLNQFFLITSSTWEHSYIFFFYLYLSCITIHPSQHPHFSNTLLLNMLFPVCLTFVNLKHKWLQSHLIEFLV